MTHDTKKMNEQEVQTALASLPGWTLKDNGMIHKTFECADFNEALGWMVRAGLEAEKMDHHPDWCNSWNRVHVHLMTHSIEGLSQKDFALAQKMEELAG